MKDKAEDGWRYGEVKDPVAKTHPAFLPYNELPEHQRIKDHIFQSTLFAAKTFYYDNPEFFV